MAHSSLMQRFGLLLLLVASVFSTGLVSAHSTGIYASEAEAQERAKQLGCESVHQNNGLWMPCSDESELHRMLRKE